ncbi:MAG: exodeoxyribonuclease VII large subunit, partial [Sarcina sp.]
NMPSKVIEREKENLNLLEIRLKNTINIKFEREREKISSCNKLLLSMNPLNVLDRGFSVISDEDGNLINSINNLETKEKINIKMRDGEKQGVFEIVE